MNSMKNAKDATVTKRNIMVVGPTGSGKTTLIRTLPGRVLAYLFDPNALMSLQGADVDYEEFLPGSLELDSTIKGFNKGARPSDRPSSDIEPKTYLAFVDHINKQVEKGTLDQYDWICFDSLTYLSKACMDRQLWINRRYGQVEDLADFRIVGSKLSDVFRPIASLDKSIFCTGHISEFQDEKTKKITTQLMLPGGAKTYLPLMFTDIMEARGESTEKEIKYTLKTRPESRGLQTIRTAMRGLDMYEDVTVKDFSTPHKYGIAKLIEKSERERSK
jgi:hypothetical protein